MTSCSLLPETRKQRNRFLFPSWSRPRTEPQALTVKPLKQTCKWNHINKQTGLTWALKSGGICAIRGLNCRQREFWHRHLSVRQCFMLSRCTTTLLFYKTTPVRFRAESQVWWQLSVLTSRDHVRQLEGRFESLPLQCTCRNDLWQYTELPIAVQVSATSVWMCVCEWPNADSCVVRHLGWSLRLEKRFINSVHSINMQPQVIYIGAGSQ